MYSHCSISRERPENSTTAPCCAVRGLPAAIRVVVGWLHNTDPAVTFSCQAYNVSVEGSYFNEYLIALL